METLIGIFASPGEYAERLAAYINSRRDVGYGGICFHDNSELEEFFRSGEMSILLTDDPNHLKSYNSRTRVCFLCDDKEKAENENEEIHFKFLRASALLQHVLPSLKDGFVKNNIRIVFSPSSDAAARAGAAK